VKLWTALREGRIEVALPDQRLWKTNDLSEKVISRTAE
jgi:hypothetical protein